MVTNRRSTRIAYLSDLHLDFHRDQGKQFLDTLEIPKCDLLVVAGDLMDVSCVNPEYAFKAFCDKAPKVLYVTGNHEAYFSSLRWSEDLINKVVKKFPQVTVVSDAKTFNLDGIDFLAGTLWFPDGPENGYYRHLLNDFSKIDDLEPEIYDRNRRFNDLLHHIKYEKIVVVSHHMPSYRSVNPKFLGDNLNRFFVGGEFAELIESSKIKCWIHGHGHDRVDYKIGNTRIVSNPVGYPKDIPLDWCVRTIEV